MLLLLLSLVTGQIPRAVVPIFARLACSPLQNSGAVLALWHELHMAFCELSAFCCPALENAQQWYRIGAVLCGGIVVVSVR